MTNYMKKLSFLPLAYLLFFSLAQASTSTPAVKGIVIVGHGLNNNYSAMSDIVHELESHQLKTIPLILAGHNLEGSPDTPMPDVSETEWLADFKAAYETASAEALKENCPLYFLGYSLSSLVGLVAIQQNPEFKLSGMLLLAPPIETQMLTHLPNILPGRSLNLPSLTPAPLRAHKGTSIGAYKSLFRLQELLKLQSLATIPTRVVMDPQDELLDVRRTSVVIQSQAPHWEILLVNATLAHGYGYHHLLVDPKSTGAAAWSQITAELFEVFR